MRLHQLTELPADFDAGKWEAEQLRELGVPEEIGMRHRLPHFSHIFDGGYSASYYAYTWAEAMDADGFDAFKETGNVFDPTLADPEWGEQVKALVVTADSVTDVDGLDAELISWCRERLARYKCPRSVEFRETLPRTETGKLLKRTLREEFWSASGRHV